MTLPLPNDLSKARDWAAIARLSMEGDEEATVLLLLRDVVIAELEDRLDFNVRAYGKAWTGEGEDTNFLVDAIPGAIIERLRETGHEVVQTHA